MTEYSTLEAEECLSDLANEDETSRFKDDVIVSIGFKSEDGEWKEAYLNSDPNGEFLSYQVDDFGKAYGDKPEVEVHRSKVVNGTDLDEAVKELDPAHSPGDFEAEELDSLF